MLRGASHARFRVFAAFAAVYLIWGSTYLAIKYAIQTLPPFLMAGTRFLAAGGLLYLWASLRGAERPQKVHWRPAFIIGGLLLLCGNGGVVLGQHKVPSGVAALLVGSEPLWVVILDWLFFSRRRPSGGSLFGLLLGFAGVALLVAPWEMRGADRVDPLSAFIIIAAALCWAYGSLYSRTAVLPSSPLMSTALQMLAGGLLLLLMGSLRGEWLHFRTENFSSLSVAAWGYLCLFGSIVGFTAYMYLLKTVGAARASTYAYVNPVVAVFLGWIVGGEPLAARTLLAAAVIVTAVVIILLRQAKLEEMVHE